MCKFEKVFINFINRINFFGTLPLCNLNERHGFYIGAFCFPLCVRCTAIILSLIITTFLQGLLKYIPSKKMLFISAVCIFFCLLDGCLQYFFTIESTNIRRLLTGLSCGFGISTIITSIIKKLS